jgi:hypothetical protein
MLQLDTIIIASAIHDIQKNDGKIRGSLKNNSAPSAKASCVSHHISFSCKWQGPYTIWLEDGDTGCHSILHKGSQGHAEEGKAVRDYFCMHSAALSL